MIRIFCGKPGAGKTSLMTYFKILTMTVMRFELLQQSIAIISQLNAGGYNFNLPTEHVTYSNYWTRSIGKFIQKFDDYELDGTDFGLYDPEHSTKLVPPGAQLFFMEAQSFLNSRASMKFRESVSRAYELHRHWWLDIYLDCQRATLIDLNIRELCGELIEVLEMNTKEDSLGSIIECRWKCHVFKDSASYEAYINAGKPKGDFEEKEFVFSGNIFECYESRNNSALFLEGRENQNFTFIHNVKPHFDIDYIKNYCQVHSLNNLSKNNYLKNKNRSYENVEEKEKEEEDNNNSETIEVLFT